MVHRVQSRRARWCEDEAVLTSMFALSHTSICTSQDTSRVQQLCTLVKSSLAAALLAVARYGPAHAFHSEPE